MTFIMERVFHPIGQGAFYSETFYEDGEVIFRMVYDCGTNKRNEHSKNVVENAFEENLSIDLLCISHFDYDHISEIETLKENHEIKVVMMPYIHKTILLSALVYKCENEDELIKLAELITNPNQFFGENTKIVFVKSSDKKFDSYEDDINFDRLNDNPLLSGTRIKIFNNNLWYFIPYNFEYEKYHSAFIDLLEDNNIDIDNIQHEIICVDKRNKIKKCYKKLHNKLNDHSMLLYSGPDNNNYSLLTDNYHYSHNFYRWKYNKHYLSHECNVGCIYTGDANLFKIDIRQIYGQFYDLAMTIQIPHHGSRRSSSAERIGFKRLCPVSFGIGNLYRHPNFILLQDLKNNCCLPIMVNEFNEYIQHIVITM